MKNVLAGRWGRKLSKDKYVYPSVPLCCSEKFEFTICKKKEKQNQPGQVKGKEGGGGGDEDGGQVELLLPHLFSNGGSFNSFLYF